MRALVALGRIAVLGGAVVLLAGCSSDTPASGEPLVPASLEEIWGITAPESVSGFLSTQIDQDESHVVFDIAPAEIDELVDDSGLTLEAGRRTITHASPLWELNPAGEIAGADDDVDAGHRTIEVVTGGEVATVRIVLRRSAD